MFKTTMAEFLYSVWFTDLHSDPDDQDREWVACIGIDAPTGEDAQEWGDRLARDRSARFPADQFKRSSVELRREARGVTDWSTVPHVRVGQLASDQEIGW